MSNNKQKSWTADIKSAAESLGVTDNQSKNWLSNIFSSNKNDVVMHREATFLSNNARVSAYTNNRGGTDPTFNKSNLYGFSIFQFSHTFGNGWNQANIGSLLGDITIGSLTGGDDAANIGSYFFNVNPRAINISEPFTTNITPTQRSGLYVESQGIILRPLSITGTTGYRPNIELLSKNENGQVPVTASEATGFLNHTKLINLFRNYSDLKKDPNQGYRTYLVYYDGRKQEAWYCEPLAVDTARSSGSPFTSTYSINAVLLKKMAFSAIASSLKPFTFDQDFLLESMRLGGVALRRENLPSWLQTVANVATNSTEAIDDISTLVDSANKLAHQAVLGVPGASVGAFLYTGAAVVTKAATLAFNVSTTLNQLLATTDLITGESGDLSTAYEEFGVDIQTLATRIIRNFASAVRIAADRAPSPAPQSTGGSSKYVGNLMYTPKTVPGGVKDLFKWFQKFGGTKDLWQVFLDVNGLEFPYYSNVPGDSVVTPGDSVLVPVPAKAITGNIDTILLPFNMESPLLEEVLGRDLKLSQISYEQGHQGYVFDLTDTGDLDLVSGRQNMLQAISIKLNTPKGDLPMHPGFGRVDVVGSRATRNLIFSAYLAYNDSMLSDGRIEALSDIDIRAEGNVLKVFFVAHIIGDAPSVPVGLSLGV